MKNSKPSIITQMITPCMFVIMILCQAGYLMYAGREFSDKSVMFSDMIQVSLGIWFIGCLLGMFIIILVKMQKRINQLEKLLLE